LPSEIFVREQTAGVVVVRTTGNPEVALGESVTDVPNGADPAGENAIVCAALAPVCGVVTPEIATDVEAVVATANVVPAKPTVIWQVPFQRALIVARVCTVDDPTYSVDPTIQTFGVAEVNINGVVPVTDSLI
jgi:hypothetical protein